MGHRLPGDPGADAAPPSKFNPVHWRTKAVQQAELERRAKHYDALREALEQAIPWLDPTERDLAEVHRPKREAYVQARAALDAAKS